MKFENTPMPRPYLLNPTQSSHLPLLLRDLLVVWTWKSDLNIPTATTTTPQLRVESSASLPTDKATANQATPLGQGYRRRLVAALLYVSLARCTRPLGVSYANPKFQRFRHEANAAAVQGATPFETPSCNAKRRRPPIERLRLDELLYDLVSAFDSGPDVVGSAPPDDAFILDLEFVLLGLHAAQ